MRSFSSPDNQASLALAAEQELPVLLLHTSGQVSLPCCTSQPFFSSKAAAPSPVHQNPSGEFAEIPTQSLSRV